MLDDAVESSRKNSSRVMCSVCRSCLFEVVVNSRRVVNGRVSGSTFVISLSNSPVVVDAGRGKQTVGGSDRPGKVSSRTLIVAAIPASAFSLSSRRGKGKVRVLQKSLGIVCMKRSKQSRTQKYST